jgi:membrane protease YdiL (CAAX protease family)
MSRFSKEWFCVILFVAGSVGFGLFAHRSGWGPLRWLFLAGAFLGLSTGWALMVRPLQTTIGDLDTRHVGLSIIATVLLAGGAAVAYRWHTGETLVPLSLTWFVLPAMAIGFAEELLWRGWLQGLLCKAWAPVSAALIAALCHTGYKLALFAFPPEGVPWHTMLGLFQLAVFTLVAGLSLGWMRSKFNTVIGPICSHMLFDLLVYGDRTHAPWWVW